MIKTKTLGKNPSFFNKYLDKTCGSCVLNLQKSDNVIKILLWALETSSPYGQRMIEIEM